MQKNHSAAKSNHGMKKQVNPPRHVIDLSGVNGEDDDALLSELLDDDEKFQMHRRDEKYPLSVSTAATEDSPPTPGRDLYGSSYRNKSRGYEYDDNLDAQDDVSEEDDGGDEDEEEDDDDDVSSMESEDVHTLLDRAHDRLHLQELQDEVQHLKDMITRKNEELERLSGQLRRAVSTKCDLVLAHNELEAHHEQNLKRRDEGLMHLKRANLSLVEAQSEVERDLLNEIYELTQKMGGLEAFHKRDIEEREELHRQEMDQKDQKIARLQEELRRVKYGKKQPRGPVSLAGFLKK